MTVDVRTAIDIDRSRHEVADFASDPDNATRWYANIKEVQWQTPRPLRVGTLVTFVARFLGRRLMYTYEIVDFAAGQRLTMRTAAGPFPMETTYTFEAIAPRQTRMQLRNRGEPTGFSKLLAPFVAFAMRAENRKDLRRLKTILEHDA